MRVELPGTQPGAGNRVSSGPDWSAITSVHACHPPYLYIKLLAGSLLLTYLKILVHVYRMSSEHHDCL